jgi:Rieske 2Fe-2S family protein
LTTTLPPSLLATLRGHYYTDPAIFAVEQDARYRPHGVLVPSEHHIAAFHEWLTTKLG